jgi:hypothetical protein
MLARKARNHIPDAEKRYQVAIHQKDLFTERSLNEVKDRQAAEGLPETFRYAQALQWVGCAGEWFSRSLPVWGILHEFRF